MVLYERYVNSNSSFACTILLLILSLCACDSYSKDDTFCVSTNPDISNGRYLELKKPMGRYDGEYPDPTKRYEFCIRNLLCLNPDGMECFRDTFEAFQFQMSTFQRHEAFPVSVHRASGKIDTLYMCWRFMGVPIGYVSGQYEEKNWLIVECKEVGKILGYDYLADESYRSRPTSHLSMADYTYEGQEKVFESKRVSYWIASTKTLDLYGPLTKKELSSQIKALGLSLPIKLHAICDQYARARRKNGEFIKPFPKQMNWPHLRKREGTIIDK